LWRVAIEYPTANEGDLDFMKRRLFTRAANMRKSGGSETNKDRQMVIEPPYEPLLAKYNIQTETMSNEIASQLFNVKRGANDPVDEWHTFAPNETQQKIWAEGRQRMKKASDTFIAAGRTKEMVQQTLR
jgi:hypothetical protein